MTTIGYATLDVIPSLRGVQSSIEKQAAGGMAAAGKSSGAKFGDAAGLAAGSSMKSKLASQAKSIAAPLAAVFAGAAVFNFFKTGITDAREYQKAIAAAGQIIESTGGVANVTTADIERLSATLEQQTAVDDALIARGAGLLLTFKNLHNEVGAGNAIFDRATAAALDLAAVGFGSVDSTAKQLGKALNDPVKGMTALSRAGVTFTQSQQDQIKALSESNQLLAAQKIILAEVESQVGGAAAAQVTNADRAAVAFDNLRQKVGEGLIPVLNVFSGIAADKVIPALSITVDLVGKAVSAFDGLPAPVKAAATAFALLKVSSALGLTSAIGSAAQSGLSRTTGLMDSLRQRVSFVQAAYSNARTATFQFSTTTGQASGSVSRLRASLLGLRAGLAGAGAAAKGFAVSVLPVAALTGAITLWSKFSEGQQAAKARVDDLKASLDAQTGALTEASEAAVFKALQDAGAIDIAKDLGVSLADLKSAALGNADAMERVNRVLDEYGKAEAAATTGRGAAIVASDRQVIAANKLRDAIFGQNSDVDQAVEGWKDQAEFTGKAADATDGAAGSMETYGGQVKTAQQALRKLIDAEQERRDLLLKNRRDVIALEEQLANTREESREGPQGVDPTSAAGRENMSSLLDLAEQFNNSTAKVRNENFEKVRSEFVRLADKMGLTTKQAKNLADELLRVPKTAPVKFQSEGYQKTKAELDQILYLMSLMNNGVGIVPFEPEGKPGRNQHGGIPVGTGAQQPTNSPGGHPAHGAAPFAAGTTVNLNGPVTVNDGRDLLRDTDRRRRRAQTDNVRNGWN